GPGRGLQVPGPQRQPQAETAPTFAGQVGGVRRLRVASLGNIAPSHTFLGPISSEGRRIGIGGRAVEEAQATEQFRPKFVVARLQVPQGLRTETQQESSQRVTMREIVQTQQRWDQTVVAKALSVLDPTLTGHDG